MKKIALAVLAMVVVLGGVVFLLRPTPESKLELVRIGWQPPLATQGQLVQILKNTDILERHGFRGEFQEFSFGSPQVEAARAGKVDVIFVGDQPALNLVASGAPWKLTSQLFETRVGLLVPPGSTLTVEQLAGKTIASPTGSVAHREATFFASGAGVDPQDVKFVGLDVVEIANLVRTGNWGEIDAIAIWEPSVTQFIAGGLAKMIAEKKTLGVVAASDAFLARDDTRERLQATIEEAWRYLLQNPEQANAWYLEVTGKEYGYTNEFLTQALDLDRNGARISAAGEGNPDPALLDLRFSPADKCALQRGLQWLVGQGTAQSVPQASNFLLDRSPFSCGQ